LKRKSKQDLADRLCNDNVFCLKQIIEKKVATDREDYIIFVDLQKAYDNVLSNRLWETLKTSNIDYTLIKALQNLYEESNSLVKIENQLTERFKVTKGLRHRNAVYHQHYSKYRSTQTMEKETKRHGDKIN